MFFPEKRDKTDEVCAEKCWQLEIRYSRSLLAWVKPSTLLSNEERYGRMKVGSFMYRSTWSEWLHLVYCK